MDCFIRAIGRTPSLIPRPLLTNMIAGMPPAVVATARCRGALVTKKTIRA